jgi:hypothetical protein
MQIGDSVLLALFAIEFLATDATHDRRAIATPVTPCSSPPYRQFDFFAGDWDTFDVSAPTAIIARNHVTRMVDSCALREVYEQRDGLRGESFSTYDVTRQVWHQSWVTNRGTLLLLDGGLRGDSMVLTATESHTDGSKSLLRGTWWREGGGVRERAERSLDGGTKWTPVFDIVFRPHRAGSLK